MKIPADFRSFVLAFLVGTVFSYPVGFVVAVTVRPIEPPEWVDPIYLSVVLSAFVLLPFWSHFALKREPLLRRLGIGAFQIAIFYFVMRGLFFSPL